MTKAREQGLEVLPVVEAASRGDLVMILLPDERHHDIWEQEIRDGIAEGNMLLFSHGFSIHYKRSCRRQDVDVIMVAPKGPGHIVRRQFTEGKGVPGLIAVYQNASGKARRLALAWAKGIGGTRGGVIETTFKEETETDLFGEQTVLCGGATALVQAGFETLVEAGYRPGDGLLRVPARAEAHRRSDEREPASPACASRFPTPPSTATTRAASA